MISDVEDFFTKGCGRCDRFDTPRCSTKLWSEGLSISQIGEALGVQKVLAAMQAQLVNVNATFNLMLDHQVTDGNLICID